jgi:hypothetical protein
MQFLFAYLLNLRNRRLAAFLAHHGRTITLLIRDSQTREDTLAEPSSERRYLHAISATWTDPSNGKAYVFQRQVQSKKEDDFKIGNMVRVLVDPNNFRRYVMQV